jgi:Ca2+-binding EF-hand superfamily protein
MRFSEAQRDMAEELGVTDVKLFLEFRQELSVLRDLFHHYDPEGYAFLDKNELWIILSTLGLVPVRHEDRLFLMEMIEKLSSPGVLEKRRPRVGLLLDVSSASQVLRTPGKFSFSDFLNVLRKVRSSMNRSMHQELKPLFERSVRRLGAYSFATTLGILEVTKALNAIGIAPQNQQDQLYMKALLDDANEFGFEPPALDFEAFVRFVRKLQEWEAGATREKERKYAEVKFGFSSYQVNEYRVAFDLLDKSYIGELDESSVRKVFKLLGQHFSSEHLRDAFQKADANTSGTIDFLEFLGMAYEVLARRRHTMEMCGVEDMVTKEEKDQMISNMRSAILGNKFSG